MSHRRLLLLSNSSNYGEEYLRYPLSHIRSFLGAGLKHVLFVPYAGVRMTYDDYTARVRDRFEEIGYYLDSVHESRDPLRALEDAEAIAVGGGNTFHLLRGLYEANLIAWYFDWIIMSKGHDLVPSIRAYFSSLEHIIGPCDEASIFFRISSNANFEYSASCLPYLVNLPSLL